MPNDSNKIDRLIDDAFEHDRSSMPAQPESPDARLLEQLARSTAPSQTSSAGSLLTTGAASPVLTKVFLALFVVAVVGSAIYILTRSSDAPIAPPAPVRMPMPIDSPVAPQRIDTTNVQSVQDERKATPLPATKRTDTTLTPPVATDDNLLPPATRKRYRSDSANVPIHQAQRRLPK